MLNLQPISLSGLSNIQHVSFPKFAPKARGDTFIQYGLCDMYKQLKSIYTPLSNFHDKWSNIFNTHILQQRMHIELYYRINISLRNIQRRCSASSMIKWTTQRLLPPHFFYKTEATDYFMKLFIIVTSMIAHGHDTNWYAHHGLGIFPTNSNHIIKSITKLLCDLEARSKNSLH